MFMRERRVLVSLCFAVTALACAGAGQERSTPSVGSKSDQAKEEPSRASGGPSTGGGQTDKTETAATSSESEDSPTRSAKDVLLKPDVLYVFSFADSEPHQAAEKHCKQSSHDDPQKTADCMQRESKRVDQDALSFQQDEEGKYWWLTVKRKGNSLVPVHRIGFEFGKDSDKKIVLKPHGPDKGTKPLGAIPKELVIEVDGESEIAIKDPKLGRLVYQAKLGLLGKPER